MEKPQNYYRRSALILTSLLCLWACQKQNANQANANRAPAPIAVTAKPAASVEWADQIMATGTLSANESTAITAKVTETVARLNFNDGDEVQAGDVLVELTGQAEAASLREAQSALRESERQLQRLSTVADRGTVTRAQVESQGALRDQASARRDGIRARLRDRVITAPFAGVLGFRQVSPGALVTPGTVITTLDDISVLNLDFAVPEAQLKNLKLGDVVKAQSIAFPDEAFVGKVELIDSRVSQTTRSVKVRTRLANDDRRLKPGMLLNVTVFSAPRQALVVDEIAVLQSGKQAYVFVAGSDGKSRRVDIEIGTRNDGMVEVTKGLSANELVVVEGTQKIRDGMAIQLPSANPASAGANP